MIKISQVRKESVYNLFCNLECQAHRTVNAFKLYYFLLESFPKQN